MIFTTCREPDANGSAYAASIRRVAPHDSFGGLSMYQTGQAPDFSGLAASALQHYALGPTTATFVQHNAGIVFRVEAPTLGRTYLLKLHDRAGTGPNPTVEQLEAGLCWLAGLARGTGLTLQAPVATISGAFVCQIAGPERAPIACTLQHWIAGKPPHGDFTAQHVRRIGALLARLHAYSQGHPVPADVPATRHDADALARNAGLLRTALDPVGLPPRSSAVLVATQEQIVAVMRQLGEAPAVWGAVHGDLHHDNLLFVGDAVVPIDFTGLRLAHYAYDLGVTLYHIFYQAPAIRHALLAGYQTVRGRPNMEPRVLEAFVTYAAIDNLAWNSTIPEQLASPLFQRNLQQLVAMFCTHLAEGRPFLFRQL